MRWQASAIRHIVTCSTQHRAAVSGPTPYHEQHMLQTQCWLALLGFAVVARLSRLHHRLTP
eukprot:9836838-Alexandrium_andersonii.AAC.1